MAVYWTNTQIGLTHKIGRTQKLCEFVYETLTGSILPWTEVVYQNLESKKALFYIFDSTGSVFENSEKLLF